jgi:hypothetical protein
MGDHDPSPREGDLFLDWGTSRPPEATPAEPRGPVSPAPEAEAWLRRLTPRDRSTVASLCLERRPLLFLVDPRDRWHLVEPRLRITGLDASDLQDHPDGEFRMMVLSDSDPSDVAYLLRLFRESRPPRVVVTERLPLESQSVREQARLRENSDRAVNHHPAPSR